MQPNMGSEFTGISIVFFCHDGKGRFVMNKRGQKCRDERGRWEIGGGALEFDDDVIERLKKEVKEEYGADAISYEFLGYRDVHRMTDSVKTHWITLDFSVLIDPAQVKNGEPEKFDAVELVTADTIPSPTHSQFPKFWEKYKDRLSNSI